MPRRRWLCTARWRECWRRRRRASAAASRVGLLAGVRDVRLHVLRLDDIESDLFCEVTHLAGDNFTAMYEFALRDQDRALLSGRASVVLDAGRRLRL